MKWKAFCCNGPQLGNTLRRYSFLAVINLIAGFLALPLALFFRLQSGKFSQYADITKELAEHLGANGMYVYGGFAAVMAFIAAMVLFNYLHQSRQINFYHAQPLGRTQMMTTRLLTALTTFLAPYLLNLLLCAVITLPYGVSSYIPWNGVLTNLLYCLLVYMVFFSITVFAGQLTGTTLAQLEVTGFILLFPFAVSLAISTTLRVYLDTYTPGFFYDLVEYISPIIYFSGAHNVSGGWLAFYVVAALTLMAMNYLLYYHRPMEQAGQAVAWPIVGQLLRMIGGIVVGIGFGTVFGTIVYGSNHLLYSLIGMVIGLVLWNMICQVQIFHSFKGAFKGLRSLTVLLVSLVGFSILLDVDPLGFDTRIPEPSQVSGVTMSVSNYYGDQPRNQSLLSTNDGLMTLKGPKTVELALKLIETSRVNEQDNDGATAHVYMEYHYRFGLRTAHDYTIALHSDTRSLGEELLNQPEVIESILAAPALNPTKQPTAISFLQAIQSEALSFSSEYPGFKKASEVYNKLLETIPVDVKRYGLSIDSTVVARIDVQFPMREFYTIDIFDNMQSTLAMLKEAGWYMDYASPEAVQEILSLTVPLGNDGYIDAAEETKNPTESGKSITSTDPKWIASVLKASKLTSGTDMWLQDSRNIRYELLLTLRPDYKQKWGNIGWIQGENQITIDVAMDPDELPEDIRKQLK